MRSRRALLPGLLAAAAPLPALAFRLERAGPAVSGAYALACEAAPAHDALRAALDERAGGPDWPAALRALAHCPGCGCDLRRRAAEAPPG